MLAGRHGLTTLCRPRHRDFLQWTERLLHADWAVDPAYLRFVWCPEGFFA